MIKSVQSSNQWQSVMQTVDDIVTKGHGGRLAMETEEGSESKLIIFLPIDDTR